MNIKIILIFSFVFTCTNIIASNSDEETYSCWEFLTSCCVNRSEHNEKYSSLSQNDHLEKNQNRRSIINNNNKALFHTNNPLRTTRNSSRSAQRNIPAVQVGQTSNEVKDNEKPERFSPFDTL